MSREISFPAEVYSKVGDESLYVVYSWGSENKSGFGSFTIESCRSGKITDVNFKLLQEKAKEHVSKFIGVTDAVCVIVNIITLPIEL